MELISCSGINMTYMGGKVSAVRNVTFSLNEGITVITGKSGSGKTTLLNILGGLREPSSGEVIYDKLNLYKEADLDDIRQHHFGFVFQAYNLIRELNVEDNILLPLYIQKKNNREKFEELVDKLELQSKLKQLPETLSGGEQQRVAIARALITDPRIIFADEPTGNLDEGNKIKVIELFIRACRENGASLIMVTHDTDIKKYADYLYYMKDGQIFRE